MLKANVESTLQTGSDGYAVGALSTFRDVTWVQWNAFFAAFLGWLLDGFDFSILSFLLIDIEHSFTVDKALAGALGTVTLMFRLVGGMGAGTAADRFGRKFPLILSILWLSLFSVLGGFSTSYAMLFAFRALFGIGMGGGHAAGARTLARPSARRCVRTPGRRLLLGLHAGCGGFSGAVSVGDWTERSGMANVFVAGRATGIAGVVDCAAG